MPNLNLYLINGTTNGIAFQDVVAAKTSQEAEEVSDETHRITTTPLILQNPIEIGLAKGEITTPQIIHTHPTPVPIPQRLYPRPATKRKTPRDRRNPNPQN